MVMMVVVESVGYVHSFKSRGGKRDEREEKSYKR